MQSQVQRSSVFSLYSIIPSGYQSFQIFLTSFHLLVPLRIVPPDSATAYRTQRKKKCRFLSHVGTPTHHAGLMNGWFGGTHLGNLHIKMYKHVKLWIDEEKSLGFSPTKKGSAAGRKCRFKQRTSKFMGVRMGPGKNVKNLQNDGYKIGYTANKGTCLQWPFTHPCPIASIARVLKPLNNGNLQCVPWWGLLGVYVLWG